MADAKIAKTSTLKDNTTTTTTTTTLKNSSIASKKRTTSTASPDKVKEKLKEGIGPVSPSSIPESSVSPSSSPPSKKLKTLVGEVKEGVNKTSTKSTVAASSLASSSSSSGIKESSAAASSAQPKQTTLKEEVQPWKVLEGAKEVVQGSEESSKSSSMGSEFSQFVWDDDAVDKRIQLFESDSEEEISDGEKTRSQKERDAAFKKLAERMIANQAHTEFNLPHIVTKPTSDGRPIGAKKGIPMKYFTCHEDLRWEWVDPLGNVKHADAIGAKNSNAGKNVSSFLEGIGWGPLQ